MGLAGRADSARGVAWGGEPGRRKRQTAKAGVMAAAERPRDGTFVVRCVVVETMGWLRFVCGGGVRPAGWLAGQLGCRAVGRCGTNVGRLVPYYIRFWRSVI